MAFDKVFIIVIIIIIIILNAYVASRANDLRLIFSVPACCDGGGPSLTTRIRSLERT